MSSVPQGFDVTKLKDRNYKGEDFNIKQELGNGPFNQRRCTDMLCCLIFTLFIVGMGVCTIFGYAHGDPNKLVSPIDGDGNICGVTDGYQDYPYLFIADISGVVASDENIFINGVCVKKCPEDAEQAATLDCKTTNEITSCSNSELNSYGTKTVFDYCMPIYDTLNPTIKE